MNNSSDIFCLKKPRFGENDGTLMFSIKGTCSSKISRSHNISSDVFQYGHPQMSESPHESHETSIPKRDETETDGLEAADLDVEEEEELDEAEPVSSSNMSHSTSTGDEDEPSDPSAFTAQDEPSNCNEYAVGHEASAGGEPGVSSSNMSRNPVTGVGLEDDRVTSRRHYREKPDKCFW